jgi:hypothetical protein
VTRKSTRRKAEGQGGVINFDFGNRTYQIDPLRRKVYRSFVEIETSKAFEIFLHWRSSEASV